MASVQAKMMTFFLRKLKSRAFKLMDNHEAFRLEKEKIFSRVSVPKTVKVKHFDLDGMEAARFLPSNVKYAHKVVLYLHGGGYTTGSIKSHGGLIGKIAQETGIPHIAINYRLAPEHPFPAGLNDATYAYRWLLEKEHFNPKDIIIMGDSAGGGLALSTLLNIKDLGLPMPLCSVVMSPWTDLTVTGESALTEPEKDPILDVEIAREWARWYAGSTSLKDPLVSPIYGNFQGLPPILIQVGSDEILLSDSVRLATFAAIKDWDVTIDIQDDMPHVWHFFWQYLPEAKAAIKDIADYLDKQIVGSENYQEWKSVKDLETQGLGRKTVAAAKLSFEALKLGRNVLKKKFYG